MLDQGNIFEILRIALFWSSPVIFLVGLLLVLYANYKRLEEFFGKELFGIKKKVFPMLETNIYVFHEWLLEKKTLLGVICIVLGVLFFLEFRK